MLVSYDSKKNGSTLKYLHSQPTEDVESTLTLKLMLSVNFRMHLEALSLKCFLVIASYIFDNIKTNIQRK